MLGCKDNPIPFKKAELRRFLAIQYFKHPKGEFCMEINYVKPNEKPLDTLAENGGYTAIFRKIACVGDSLSSGEFESISDDGTTRGYNDMFEYSWGQFIARMCGSTVYNFSRGGMTAKWYCTSFADSKDFWNKDLAAQAYIIALGGNDLFYAKPLIDFGSIDDIDLNDWRNNKPTFVGYYAQIIQRYKEIQPRAKFFLVTFPSEPMDEQRAKKHKAHSELIYKLAEMFDNTYVIDLGKYAPLYDEKFKKNFYLQGHMNPMGYMFTAKIISSYIDFIIRSNMSDFKEVGFIGTDLHG